MKNSQPGRHRNWSPVDFRIEQVPWPKEIDAICPGCGSKISFEALQTFEFKGTVFKQQIPSSLQGHGVCPSCVKVVNRISWPEHAFFKYQLRDGVVWAWSLPFVEVLQARLQALRKSDGDYLAMHELALHYLARLPKFVVLKKNRALLLKKFENA